MIDRMVICNKAKTCLWHRRDKERGHGCGGAEPHYECPECGNCPSAGEAKCVPIETEGEATTTGKDGES